MNFYNVISNIESGDTFQYQNQALSVDFQSKKEIPFSFWDYKKNKNILSLPHFYRNEAIDLLYLSLSVYYADRIIERNLFPDGWTRYIKIFLPVLEYEKWLKNTELVEELLSYLSGDIWKVEFRKRNLNEKEKEIQEKILNSSQKFSKPDFFCMLSGGIDSFIGAIDLLESNAQVNFIGLYGGSKGVSQYQKRVNSILLDKYAINEENFFNFFVAPKNGKENSTRTRSLLFFAHAIALISTFPHINTLLIPENGFISLNIPLTYTRLGSSSTRTTHPYYIKLLQILMNNLGLDILLTNPYQFKTKGEMILESKNIQFFKSNIRNTMSCSHPDNSRYMGKSKPNHCGYCLPCTIRRAAILHAFGNDTTYYQDKKFKSGDTARNNLKVYKIGIHEHRVNKSKVNFNILSSGPLDDNFDKYGDLYRRGIEEMGSLVDKYEY